MKILAITHVQEMGLITTSFIDNQLKAHARRGNEVKVIVTVPYGKKNNFSGRFGPPIIKKEHEGVEYVCLRYLSLSKYGERIFNVSSFISTLNKRFNQAIGDFKPDIIHAHTVLFDSRIGIWLKEKLGVPLVVTTHGGDLVSPLERGWNNLLKDICDKVDALSADSSVLGKKFSKCNTTTPVYPITLGYESEDIAKLDVDTTWGKKTHKRIIQVGNLIPSKRVNVTIDALKILHDIDANYHLIVIGDGPNRGKLQEQVDACGLSESVTFTGTLPNLDVMREMAKAKYFVMVSAPEGLGIAYIEAMSQGCVTVGTEGEGITDVIRDGENGFLVPVDRPDLIAERILSCESDLNLALKISENAVDDAGKLTWDRTAEEYEELFKKVIFEAK